MIRVESLTWTDVLAQVQVLLARLVRWILRDCYCCALRGEFLVGRLVVAQHGHRACVRITWLDSSLDSLSSVVSSPLGDIPARTIGNSGTGCLVLAGRGAGAARSAACTTDKGHSVA